MTATQSLRSGLTAAHGGASIAAPNPLECVMRVALCVVVVALAGCVGIPPQELQASGGKTVLASARPPATVYRQVATGSRACFERSFEVVSDYFPDAQTGRVSVSLRTPFALSSLYVAEVRPADAGSAVTVSVHPSAERYGRKVIDNMRHWLDDEPRCTD